MTISRTKIPASGLCLLFVTAFLVVGFAAFASGAKDSGAAASAAGAPSIATPPGTFPVVAQMKTYTFFAPQSTIIEDISTNAFTVMYEKKSNVHIKWELVPANDLANMKRLSFASGDYPDAYMGCGITRDEEMEFGGKLFIPLNDLIDKNTIWFKEVLGSLKFARAMITSSDGNIYCFPATTYEDSHLIAPNRNWINTSWLKTLNLKAPTTTDEYRQTMKAFKSSDPNRNGKADEIPMILTSPSYTRYGNASFFMCAFVYDDGGDRFRITDDDKVDPVFIKPEWRDGIKYLKMLYDEGLTDSTAFTLNWAGIKELVEKADAELVGMVGGLYQGSFANIDGERQAHYDALPPLKGPQGVQLTWYNPYVHATGAMAITKTCDHPEVLVRWVDWLYSFEGGLTARTGPENVNWRRPPAGSKSYAGMDATWERLKSYGVTQNYCWDGIGFPHDHSMHGHLLGKPDQFYQAAGLEDRLIKYTREYQPFIPKNGKTLPPLYVDLAVSSEYFKLKADINKYVNESFVQFITGGMNIDTQWSSFQQQLKTIGLDKYVQMTQTAYDRFVKNTSK